MARVLRRVSLRAHSRRATGRRFREQAARRMGDAGVGDHSGRVRRGRIWPIQTERMGRMRALASAALASSVWLVCEKRRPAARPGWDNVVLRRDAPRASASSLREFWDAGIRGPDFVWAATGPALEAYSKHPVVKKANDPGETMSVSEFLRAVRRLVVEFVVGRVLGELTRTSAASVGDAPTRRHRRIGRRHRRTTCSTVTTSG